MKIYIDGIIRDMTSEEEKEYLEAQQLSNQQEKSSDERIAELEEALDLLFRGATNE